MWGGAFCLHFNVFLLLIMAYIITCINMQYHELNAVKYTTFNRNCDLHHGILLKIINSRVYKIPTPGVKSYEFLYNW